MTGVQLDEGTEVLDVQHRALILLAERDFLGVAVHEHGGFLERLHRFARDEDFPIVVDLDVRTCALLDHADVLAPGTDQETDLVYRNHASQDAGCIGG